MAQYSSALQRLHYQTDLKLYTRMAVERATAITAVSKFTAALVTNEFDLGNKVRVIYNGIDETRFIPATPQHKVSKDISVLFSGNMSIRKGMQLLPKIADRLQPGIKLMYTTGLRAKGELPKHPALHCIGRVPYQSMPELYNSTDILLFPTVREGFGLAAAEAMACGLPVVASDCSSLPELVIHGMGGFLCPPGDYECFATHINQLADTPSLRYEMGAFNRTRIEQQFTLRQMITAYTELFDEIIADK